MEQFQQLKNSENWYYLVKWTSGSYNLNYYHNIGRYIIKTGELVCDVEYLNSFANFRKWYNPYGKIMKEKNVRLNTVILTEVNIQSINDIDLYDRASNNLRGGVIRFGAIYVCDVTHDEILETIFQGKNYIMMNWFWKDNLKLVMMRVNVIKNIFPYDITVSAL